MNDIKFKDHIRILFIVNFVVFVANKLLLRSILKDVDIELLSMISYSLPNFNEAIMGSFLLVGIGLQLRHHKKMFSKFSDQSIYISGITLSAIYVITQEIGLHNLGGNNIFDPNDLIASVLGLTVNYWIFSKYGFQETSISAQEG